MPSFIGLLRIWGMVRWQDVFPRGKLIDGVCSAPAHPKGNHLGETVQPYALRAPEVILGLEWGPAIDIWSLGCMVRITVFFPPTLLLHLFLTNLPLDVRICNW